MTRSCMSLNQKERVQSGSQPAGTELPEALLTVSVSLVLSTNRCAISWAMWPDPKNISNPKVESCHKIKVINQHNYICTFFHFESLMWGWKHQKSTSRKNILARQNQIIASLPAWVWTTDCIQRCTESLWQHPLVCEYLLWSPETGFAASAILSFKFVLFWFDSKYGCVGDTRGEQRLEHDGRESPTVPAHLLVSRLHLTTNYLTILGSYCGRHRQ